MSEPKDEGRAQPRTQRRGRRIAMTAEEIDAYLAAEPVCRVATIGPHGPHNVPLWFHWDGRDVWLYSIVNSQRWFDLESDPRVAIVVDSGTDWSGLRGVEIQGEAVVEGEVPRTGEPTSDAVLSAESGFQDKYRSLNPKYRDRPDAPLEYDGRHAWLRVRTSKLTSWDFRKI